MNKYQKIISDSVVFEFNIIESYAFHILFHLLLRDKYLKETFSNRKTFTVIYSNLFGYEFGINPLKTKFNYSIKRDQRKYFL